MSVRRGVSSLLLVALLVTTAGCYRATARRSSTPVHHDPDYNRWHHGLFFGLIRVSPDIDIDFICPDTAVAQVHTQISFLNGLVSVLSGGIYTPTKLRIWCARAPAGIPMPGPSPSTAPPQQQAQPPPRPPAG